VQYLANSVGTVELVLFGVGAGVRTAKGIGGARTTGTSSRKILKVSIQRRKKKFGGETKDVGLTERRSSWIK